MESLILHYIKGQSIFNRLALYGDNVRFYYCTVSSIKSDKDVIRGTNCIFFQTSFYNCSSEYLVELSNASFQLCCFSQLNLNAGINTYPGNLSVQQLMISRSHYFNLKTKFDASDINISSCDTLTPIVTYNNLHYIVINDTYSNQLLRIEESNIISRSSFIMSQTDTTLFQVMADVSIFKECCFFKLIYKIIPNCKFLNCYGDDFSTSGVTTTLRNPLDGNYLDICSIIVTPFCIKSCVPKNRPHSIIIRRGSLSLMLSDLKN